MKDLKAIYQAPCEDSALSGLDEIEEKWGKKYPSSVSSWRNNWSQFSTFLKYPEEIRKIIYTTNSIENFQILKYPNALPHLFNMTNIVNR